MKEFSCKAVDSWAMCTNSYLWHKLNWTTYVDSLGQQIFQIDLKRQTGQHTNHSELWGCQGWDPKADSWQTDMAWAEKASKQEQMLD